MQAKTVVRVSELGSPSDAARPEQQRACAPRYRC